MGGTRTTSSVSHTIPNHMRSRCRPKTYTGCCERPMTSITNYAVTPPEILDMPGRAPTGFSHSRIGPPQSLQ